MNGKPLLARPHLGTKIVAAALSSLITIGVFTVIARLFLGDGTRWAQAVIAARACNDAEFVAEREACTRAVIALHTQRVASR